MLSRRLGQMPVKRFPGSTEQDDQVRASSVTHAAIPQLLQPLAADVVIFQ
jgi:hypothetical protein